MEAARPWGVELDRDVELPPLAAAPIVLDGERCAAVDPLALLAAAGTAPRFYFEQPEARRARVGIGSLACVEVHGRDRFARAQRGVESLWARLRWQGAGPQRVALQGGFAFAPSAAPRQGQWQGFADGALHLPAYAYWQEDADSGQSWAAATGCPHPLAPLPLGRPTRGGLAVAQDDAQAYLRRAQLALREIGKGRLSKLVLAREIHLSSTEPIDVVAWLLALRERFPNCTLYAIGMGTRCFFGASPERLLRVRGREVETMALAGTAARGASRRRDAELAEALGASPKERDEHAIVVAQLRAALAGCCSEVDVDAAPSLLKTRTVQHLCTRIRARHPSLSILQLLARLHPSAAVAGAPSASAQSWLAAHEGFDRGWYAGPVGYIDADGDGEFAVALRGALVDGARISAWAGAGLVADSDPAAEYTETELKLRSVLGPVLWGMP